MASSNVSIRLLTNVTSAEVESVVEMCLRAYGDDEATKVLNGGDKSLYGPALRAMIRAGALAGSFYVATTSTGQIVGVGIWFRPGRSLYDSEDQKQLGFYDVYERLSPETKEWRKNEFIPQQAAFMKKCLGPRGVIDSWYANQIAVEPDYQRQGIATRLVQAVYNEAAKTGTLLALCAANAENEIVYNKMGFISRGHRIQTGPNGQFPVTCLTKATA